MGTGILQQVIRAPVGCGFFCGNDRLVFNVPTRLTQEAINHNPGVCFLAHDKSKMRRGCIADKRISILRERLHSLADQAIDFAICEIYLSTSAHASSKTASASRSASSGMVSGGAILRHSPAMPTGANISSPL